MSSESPDTIFQRAADRAKQMGLPYAGAVTPAEANALHETASRIVRELREASDAD